MSSLSAYCFAIARRAPSALLIGLLYLLAPKASAAIAFDAAGSKTATNASSASWSHTVGTGANMILIVGLATEDTSSSVLAVSSITYNGVAMTPVSGSAATEGSSTLDQTQLFYLVNPAAGAHTVAVTFGGAVNGVSAGSVSLSGVAQNAPAAASIATLASGKTITGSATVGTVNSWIVDVACSGASSSTLTAGSAQTSRWAVSESSSGGGSSTEPVAAAGSASTSWTAASSGQMALSLTVLAPAGGTTVTAPAITTQPASQSVAAGASATFSVVASGTAPLTYQWKFGGTAISGATSASYSVANAQSANQGSYTVTVTNAAGSATSTAATLTVTAAAVAPAITTQPASQSVAAGSSVSFAVAASGTAPLTYQWKFGTAAIAGATASTYSLANVQSANAGSYTVTVTNSAGSVTSNAATLTVTASATAPTITTQPVSQAVSSGSAVTFSVVASGTAPLTYQWKFGGSAISGATSASYTIASAQSPNAGSYTVTVTNSAGTATSNAATLTVSAGSTGAAPVITTQPVSQSVPAGSAVTFTVVASGSGNTYQWKYNGTAISGATSTSLGLTNVHAASAGEYTVTVTNSAGVDQSRVATLTTQPVIPSGVFLITTYGAKGDGTTDNTTAIQNAIAAASAAGGGTVEVPAAAAAFECGPITLASSINLQVDTGATLQAVPKASYPSATTNFIVLSGIHDVAITGGGTIDGNGAGWWSTSTRPKLVHMSSTTTVMLKNTSTTSQLTFQNSPKEHIICDIGVNNVTIDGIKVFSPSTSPNTDGIDPAGTDWIIQNCSISDGDDDVAVKAQTGSAGDILINNCTVGTGHGLSIGAQTDFGVSDFRVTNCTFTGTDYVVRLKSEDGEGGLVTNVLYDHITFSGINKAAIYISSYYDSLPSDPSSDGGSTFNATTTPQWQNITISNMSGSTVSSPSKGIGDIWGVPESPITNVVLDNVTVSGTTKTLTINHARGVSFVNGTALPLTAGSDDLYDVTPVITTQPASQSVAAGSNVTFSVVASSAGTQTYQWAKNGVAISGATSSSLTLSGVQSTNAGSYSVTVTNATGSNTSDDALLQVD